MTLFRISFLGLALPLLAAAQEAGTIEQVKKELGTLPATKADLEQNRLRMPSIAAPDTSAGTQTALPSPAALGRASQEQPTGKDTGNWLVDAMMKETERKSSGRDEKKRLRAGDRDEIDAWMDSGKGREKGLFLDASAKETPEAGDPAKLADAVDNPLLPFMNGWISKRDQALLLPKAATIPGIDAGTPLQTAVPAGASNPGLDPANLGLRADNEVAPILGRDSNPFLAGLPPARPPSSETTQVAVPVPPANAGERSPQILPPTDGPAEARRPLAPIDLAKPSPDAKYFPQLKRF